MSEHEIDHGTAPSRIWGCVISFVGFLVGGIGFVVHFNLPMIIVGAVLQVVAIAVKLGMDAAGYGRPDVWSELKAKAKAERAAAQS